MKQRAFQPSRIISRQFHASKRYFGALTSKPYAFVARPWELTSVNAIDNMNALGANIQLQTRGNELMRVLPRTNDEINDDWIDDKTRFSYDGLKSQRLIKPLCRDIENPNLWDRETHGWRDVLARVKAAFEEFKEPGSEHVKFRGIVGPSSDLYSVLALCDLAELVNFDEKALSVESTATNLFSRAMDPTNYRFNTTILGMEDADVCLLVGTNISNDCPLIASRLLKCFRSDKLRVSQLGPDNGLSFPSEQIGLSPKVLEEIANETHPYFKVLQNAEKPMVVLDASIFEREDSDAIMKAIDVIASKTNLRKTSESGQIMWDGINIFHKNANDVGILDVGKCKKFSQDHEECSILYLMNIQAEDLPNGEADVEKLAETSKFVIYQGSHGDELASIADVVLPGAAFTEKNGIYVNMEGRAQLSHRALTPPGLGKSDWTIIRAMSEVIGKTLPYSTEEELQERLETFVPSTKYSNLGEVQAPDFFLEKDDIDSKVEGISDTPFVRTNTDFHLSGHPAARVSKVMAACSRDMIAAHRNFIDY